MLDSLMTKSESVEAENVGERTFFAAVDDVVTQACIARVAEGFGWPADWVSEGGLEAAIQALDAGMTPSILIVDVSSSADPEADLQRLAELCDTDVRVLALGSENDIGLYRDLMALGVSDYLVKPVTAEVIQAALAHMMAPSEEDGGEARESRVTAILGARGGAGTSTVATAMAWLMAHQFDRKTVLFDLDLNFGTSALMLDLEPGKGLSEALANPNRVDELFVARGLVRESENLMLLSAEESIGSGCNIDIDAVTRLTNMLCATFDEVVMDVPRHALLADARILANVDRIVVVSDPSLAGLRDTRQILKAAREHAPEARIVTVLAQAGRLKDAEVSKADFEAAIDTVIDFTIPYDPKSVALATALASSVPEAAPKGLAAKSLIDMTRDIGEFVEPEAESQSLLRFLKKG